MPKMKEEGNTRHAGQGEAEIRHPVSHCCSWIPDIRRRRIPE
jgi:hypothetical protein